MRTKIFFILSKCSTTFFVRALVAEFQRAM